MVLVYALGLQFEWARAWSKGQQCAARFCCYTINMWASPGEAKGMKSIDTKVLPVVLKWFMVIHKFKGVGQTQLGHLVKCGAVLSIGAFITQTGK